MYPSGHSHPQPYAPAQASPHPYAALPHPYAHPQQGNPAHPAHPATQHPPPYQQHAQQPPPQQHAQQPPPQQQQQQPQQQYYAAQEPPRPNSAGHPAPYYSQHQHYQQQQQHASSPVSPYYSTFAAGAGVSTAPVSLPTTAAGGTAGFFSSASPVIPAAAPASVPAPALYKAEMTESQVHSWETHQHQQKTQQNIKVEVSSSMAQSPSFQYKVPVSPLPSPSPYSAIHQQPKPPLDVHTELQQELKRQSQLLAIQQKSRPSSVIGATPIVSSAQPSWSQSTVNHGGPMRPASPLPSAASRPLSPTPVEHQSSLTDTTSISSYKHASSLTTLDLAPAAAAGIHARISRPYSSLQSQGLQSQGLQSQGLQQQSLPSAIDQQSSLTEIDSTSVSSQEHASRPISRTGAAAAVTQITPQNQSAVQDSNFAFCGQRYGPASIEQQSSLTEVDSLPFPLEAQSSLTELDGLPSALEEQSSLTVVDDLPYSLQEQSALTTLDDLPYSLEEQSALTELDNLPHALSEQSSLTVLDEPSKSRSKPAVIEPRDETDSVEKSPSLLSPAMSPAAVTAAATASGQSPTSTTATTTTTTTTTVQETTTISSAMGSLSGASTSFSMSNWTMPSDFDASNTSMDFGIPKDETGSIHESSHLRSSGSLHKRAPATMHIDTAQSEDESSDFAQYSKRDDGDGILIPLSPTTPGVTSPPWKALSPSDSLRRNGSVAGGAPPVPAPKPASLLAAKVNHPQAGVSGTDLTISEEIHLTVQPSLPAESLHVDFEEQAEADSEGYEYEDDIEEGDTIAKADDGVSAFIRELQSSITLSRSGSGSSTATRPATDKLMGQVKRTDSNSSSSRREQLRETDAVGHAAIERPPEEARIPSNGRDLQHQPKEASISVDQHDSAQNLELPQLEATLFEWTFTEQEQSTYERIFSLWERPAEECVSSDIAGKVFMTLGLMNSDLYKIWQLLNPEERPVLTRTQFIAGLHLVNCKVVGYELPSELPDELMMSAAGVGRVIIPPRPVQGPSAVLPNAIESPPSSMPATTVHAAPPSPILERPAAAGYSMASNFMHAFSLPGFSTDVPGPMTDHAESAYRADSGVALSHQNQNRSQNQQQQNQQYQHQNQQYQQQNQQYQQQNQQYQQQNQQNQQHQYYQQQAHSFPQESQPALHYSPVPPPVQYNQLQSVGMHYDAHPPASKFAGNGSTGVSHTAANATEPEDTIIRHTKPGPHALHDLPADAPVIMSFEEPSSPIAPVTSSGSTSSSASNSGVVNLGLPVAVSAVAVSSTKVQNYYSVDNPALYVSPPDAWDHDAAPPELDVEGSYIKYRSDFKNDMTVSASVTANHPINPSSGVFYFEIIIDRFKGNSAISVGIASKSLRKNCQVGWDLNSWGYHSDDGFLYFGNGKQNIKYSFEYNEGDTVGCGVNFLDRAVFFTLNGDMLGVAFRFLKDSIPLYPAIGLSQAGTEINANFGDQTFLFNIVDYKKRVMSKPIHPQTFLTWNNGDRNDKVFQILADGLSVIASGKDAGCIRGPKVSPRDKDVFYFEITILYMPPTETGTLMVGMCGKDQNMKDILGWKPNSYAYSGEFGDFLSLSSNRSSLHARSQSGKMKARARGPAFRAEAVVGCGVDFASRELFFTLNGECLGQAFYDLDVLDCYPCVSVVDGGGGIGGPLSMLREQAAVGSGTGYAHGLTSTGGVPNDKCGFEFKANFGQYPFMFDMAAFEASEV
ncbi:hypothetical protein BGZ67_000669 [Mortierella alpina]|nr:hypothetical protein BGZ67_000669 [Mortierella alpina]